MSANYERLARRLPARLAAITDLVQKRLHDDHGPFNGQEVRQELVRDLFKRASFELVVETGTFRAQTTRFLAALTGATISSAEISRRFYNYARTQTRTWSNISLWNADSREVLVELTTGTSAPSAFLYLDAHWGADVPRRTELEIVRDNWPKSIIMIDDFYVPHDESFGFAEYAGRRLDESYLPPMPGWSIQYPAYACDQETGAKRGFALLAGPEVDEHVTSLTLLTARRPLGQLADDVWKPTR